MKTSFNIKDNIKENYVSWMKNVAAPGLENRD